MSDDLFKRAFKYYKAKKPPPDLSRPLDPSLSSSSQDVQQITPIHKFSSSDLLKHGLRPAQEWQAYSINNNKGLIYIRNPFVDVGQRYWIARCLRDFPRKPHKLNLDSHCHLEDWWKSCNEADPKTAVDLRKGLRWATLGYHHDWDTKIYSEENKHDFPDDLGEMCKIILSCFGTENYMPQASIVNYYHMDSTLSPHTDHSEKYLDAPLISISFGQSAIFLIGGESKEIEPTALYLHSGDIVIMSKESRLCYHAVPRIVRSRDSPWKIQQSNLSGDSHYFHKEYSDEEFWKPFADYVEESRININVRQVLNFNDKNL